MSLQQVHTQTRALDRRRSSVPIALSSITTVHTSLTLSPCEEPHTSPVVLHHQDVSKRSCFTPLEGRTSTTVASMCTHVQKQHHHVYLSLPISLLLSLVSVFVVRTVLFAVRTFVLSQLRKSNFGPLLSSLQSRQRAGLPGKQNNGKGQTLKIGYYLEFYKKSHLRFIVFALAWGTTTLHQTLFTKIYWYA